MAARVRVCVSFLFVSLLPCPAIQILARRTAWPLPQIDMWMYRKGLHSIHTPGRLRVTILTECKGTARRKPDAPRANAGLPLSQCPKLHNYQSRYPFSLNGRQVYRKHGSMVRRR